MSKVFIDGAKALELIEGVVKARGEGFVYRESDRDCCGYASCFYVFDGKPSCIVGQALADAGVDVAAIFAGRLANEQDICTLADSKRYRNFHAAVELTPDAVSVFDIAQCRQDDGDRYGDVLKAAQAVKVD